MVKEPSQRDLPGLCYLIAALTGRRDILTEVFVSSCHRQLLKSASSIVFPISMVTGEIIRIGLLSSVLSLVLDLWPCCLQEHQVMFWSYIHVVFA